MPVLRAAGGGGLIMYNVIQYQGGESKTIFSVPDVALAKRLAVEQTVSGGVCGLARDSGSPFLYAVEGRLVEAAEAIRALTALQADLRVTPAPEAPETDVADDQLPRLR
ncbi:MAG TPA: hypothetical protein PKD09_25045, partial [Aggregatilinea sp.]|uniref:hypothetical protein n=1 Tax=Aggregatilinea sp. TaxID=2806333 RepID=UPI002BBFE025